MPKKQRRQHKHLPAIASTGVSAIGAGALTVASTLDPTQLIVGAAGVGLIVVAALVQRALEIRTNVGQRDAKRFVERLMVGADDPNDPVTPEEVAGLIATRAEDPFVSETLNHALRGVAERFSPRAVEPLAVLARDYLGKQKEPDAFFRGALRLLVEATGQELEQLAVLIGAVVDEAALRSVEDLAIVADRRDGGGAFIGYGEMNEAQSLQISNKETRVKNLPDAVTLVRRLDAVELAASDRPGRCHIRLNVATRLQRLLSVRG